MKLTREVQHASATQHAPCVAPGLVAKAEAVVTRLEERGLSITTAESCTAGLLSASLSQPHRAAKVLHGGFVTYTKANKTKALGVPEDLLRREGSVTADVARHLARGALLRSPADIAIAVTGVLGPEKDEDGNPVGLVFFCCCGRDRPEMILRRDFGQELHDRLRFITVQEGLNLVLQYLDQWSRAP